MNESPKIPVSLFTNSPSDSIFTAKSLNFPDQVELSKTKRNKSNNLITSNKSSIITEKPNDVSFQLDENGVRSGQY